MGRKRAPGLRNRGGIWHIEKQVLGHKIHESTGTSNLKTAELILARRIEETRQAKIFGVRPRRTFREAAAKFLEENLQLASIADYATHLKQLDPFIDFISWHKTARLFCCLTSRRIILGGLNFLFTRRKRRKRNWSLWRSVLFDLGGVGRLQRVFDLA